ncbi:HNH endonuclease [Candidatus Poribacteria bacterium]|nr:HNH endonuclease [Candidatus Poribacteria bacterium]
MQSGDEIQPREPTEDVKEQVKARDGYRCICCGEMGKRRLEIDHVAPSYYGGDNSLANLQTLCKICNQTKGINELNFRNNRTLLTAPPSNFPELDLPIDARDPVEWEKFLRRSINSFYQCAAVDFVRIGKRGQYFYDWYVYLFAGNNPFWLDPYIDDLVDRINNARVDAEGIEINTINVDAPD